MASDWEELAVAIADNEHAYVTIPALQTQIGPHAVSMDCLQIVYSEGAWGDLVGVFHVSPGVGPNKGQHSQLYVAVASTSDLGHWTVANDSLPYAEAGSMGFIHIDSSSGVTFLAYEAESSSGNAVFIRRYASIAIMLSKAGIFDEWQLTKQVHVAGVPKTWTADARSVTNVGTPSIECLVGGDLTIRCHYSPDGAHDYPAKGMVSLGSEGGIEQNWASWAGFFDNWVNDSLRTLGARGKIGGRDAIRWQGFWTLINEAQMVQDDWSSWRVYLLVPELRKAVPIPLSISGTRTFANPHMALLPGKRLCSTSVLFFWFVLWCTNNCVIRRLLQGKCANMFFRNM